MRQSEPEGNDGSRGDESGYAFLFFIAGIILLLGYGMVAFKGSVNAAEKAELNLLIVSSLNAASNNSPSPADMFRAACNTMANEFNLDEATDCSIGSFSGGSPTATFTKLRLDGKKECTISFSFTPLTSSDANSFCIDVTNCEDQNPMIPGFLTPTLYQTGGSGCIGQKESLAYLLVDYSSNLVKIFDQKNPAAALNPKGFQIPPSYLLLPGSGYTQFTTDTYNEVPSISLSQPPGVFDDPLGQVEFGSGNAYKIPFSTKETDNTSKGRIPNQDAQLLGAGGKFIGSMPDVFPEAAPATALISPEPSTGDPIQHISKITGGWYMWKWAKAGNTFNTGADCGLGTQCRYKWRSGYATAWELTNWCFGPFKLLAQRAAQHIMYLMNNKGVKFGLAAYSNWSMPILPLPTAVMRHDPASPISNLPYLETMPLLGPSPGLDWNVGSYSLPSADVEDLVSDQFGDNSHVGAWLDRTNQARFLNGMSLCARETRFVSNPANLSRHYFTSLPDPYNASFPVAPPATTNCSSFGSPDIENYYYSATNRYNFTWSSNGLCCSKNFLNLPSSPWRASQFDSAEPCSTLLPYSLTNTMMEGGTGSGINCSPTGVGPISYPYRWCLPDQQRWPDASNALASLRAGAFSKSGYPLHLGVVDGSSVANSLPADPSPSIDTDYMSGIDDNSVYPETTDIQNIVGAGARPNDSAGPVALWSAYKTLLDPKYVANPELEGRHIVILSAGAPNISIKECLARQFQCAIFTQDPIAAGIVPSLTNQSTSNGKTYSIALRETLHLIHSAIDQGIKVTLILLDVGNSDSGAIDNLLAGLKKPVSNNGQPAGAGRIYNFCKSTGVESLAGEPASGGGTCDPIKDPDATGITHVHLIKGVNETYSAFGQRVFSEVSFLVRDHVLGFTLKR